MVAIGVSPPQESGETSAGDRGSSRWAEIRRKMMGHATDFFASHPLTAAQEDSSGEYDEEV